MLIVVLFAIHLLHLIALSSPRLHAQADNI